MEIMLLILMINVLDHTKLNVWVQDGNPKYSFLLKFALSEKNFKNTLIMFVVSMKTPWTIMDQLESWATLLQDYIDTLPIPSEELREYRQICKQLFTLIKLNN